MRSLLVTLLISGLLLGAFAPASADDRIGLSRDGRAWSGSLTEPLLDSDAVWVPGDSRTVSFYVRNRADTNAVLTTTVRSVGGDRLLAAGDIALRARAGGRWFTLRHGTPSPELTEASIRPGAPVRVDVQAIFDPASPNASQSDAVRLMFEVRLAEAVNGSQPEPGTDDDRDVFEGFLSDTGSHIPVILIWMAGIAMAAGAALVATGRREREHDHA